MSLFEDFIDDCYGLFKDKGAMGRDDFYSIVRQYEGCTFSIAKRNIKKRDMLEFIEGRLKAGTDKSIVANRAQRLFNCSKKTTYKRINEVLCTLK